MDSFELNKILGAILGTCLVLLVTSFAAGAIFAPNKPEKPGFEIAVKEEAAGGEKAAARRRPSRSRSCCRPPPVEKGEAAAKKCGACHTFAKGGPNKVGPNLYGIVGDKKGEGRGFNFSAAMKAKGGTWTDRRPQQVHRQSEGLRSRHRDGLRRHPEGQRARRRDRLSELACPISPAPLPTAAK